MKFLTADNTSVDFNNEASPASIGISILDYTDMENVDYYIKNFFFFSEYDSPVVHLKIGNSFIDVPLNWKILTGDPNTGELELVEVEELSMFDYNAFVLNPYKSYIPKYEPIEVTNVYLSGIKLFVPKSYKKSLFLVSLENKVNHLEGPYSDCVFLCDDIDRTNDILSVDQLF